MCRENFYEIKIKDDAVIELAKLKNKFYFQFELNNFKNLIKLSNKKKSFYNNNIFLNKIKNDRKLKYLFIIIKH